MALTMYKVIVDLTGKERADLREAILIDYDPDPVLPLPIASIQRDPDAGAPVVVAFSVVSHGEALEAARAMIEQVFDGHRAHEQALAYEAKTTVTGCGTGGVPAAQCASLGLQFAPSGATYYARGGMSALQESDRSNGRAGDVHGLGGLVAIAEGTRI